MRLTKSSTARAKKPRAPIQDRAIRRRASILDATARILDRDGYDALTTNAVAREAKTAVGTVYEYFDRREALLAALLERHAESLTSAIDAAVGRGPHDLLAVADRVVDAFARVWKEEPGYRAAWSAASVSGLLERTGAAWGDAFTTRVVAILAELAPRSRTVNRRAIATTAVHLVSGLLLATMSGPARLERTMIQETKVALRAYLRARLLST